MQVLPDVSDTGNDSLMVAVRNNINRSEPIGEGGSGFAYLALVNGRTYVYVRKNAEHEALKTELRWTKYLTDTVPSIVSNIVAWRLSYGALEMAFVYTPGATLTEYIGELLRRQREGEIDEGRRFVLNDTVYCMARRALDTLHAAGVTHGDIRSDNIYIVTEVDGVTPQRALLLDLETAAFMAPAGAENDAALDMTWRTFRDRLDAPRCIDGEVRVRPPVPAPPATMWNTIRRGLGCFGGLCTRRGPRPRRHTQRRRAARSYT